MPRRTLQRCEPLGRGDQSLAEAGECSGSPVDPRQGLPATGFAELPIQPDHGLAVAHLPLVPRDPFDRLLVAAREGLPLLATDSTLFGHGEPRKRRAENNDRGADGSNLGGKSAPQMPAPGVGGGGSEKRQRTWYRIQRGRHGSRVWIAALPMTLGWQRLSALPSGHHRTRAQATTARQG
jgi:hypothetical protein